MNVLCKQLGLATRRASGAVRNLSAWLSLAAVIIVLVAAGESHAFVAPSASLPLAGASSAVSNTSGHERGGNTRPSSSSSSSSSSGCLAMSADGGATPAGPTKMAAVLYTYVDGMEEKRAPHRSGHLDLLKNMSEEGSCLLGGALVEPCDGGIVLFSTPEKAREFVDNDPYVSSGLVTKYQIRDYMAVVGTMHTK
ncbi:unnamed protein product [Pylaiella littoralis]